MLPNPRPPTIPGLFQFPPALESRPAAYDDHRAPPSFASSSRIPVGMIPGAMRHNQPTPYQQPQLDSTYANSAPQLQTPLARVPQIDGVLFDGAALGTPSRHPQTPDARVPTASLSFAPSPSSSYPEHAQQYVQHSIYARAHPVPHPTHQSPPEHQWGSPHAHAQHIIPSAGEQAVKEEEEESPEAEDSAMWVSEDTPAAPAYDDTQRFEDVRRYQDSSSSPDTQDYAYSPRYVDEMVQSPVDAPMPMHECKQEDMEHDFVEQPYPVQYADEGATQNWANAAGVSLYCLSASFELLHSLVSPSGPAPCPY
ncbi:hypothetical protein K466DRAFT_361851 [Polyporus arcularius HHB13444]|uniref:Uncharacterized protein n=1 Tax=Polyporus arcularius HHB13444 TaxID=1314778 RepID=A0A5C3NX50_9APHY|nr:hypothetical protein K466DRAFT_361851 [Polyporus arcularius HHB13444]